MTLEKARELLRNQAQVAGGYTKNGSKLILAEVQKRIHLISSIFRNYTPNTTSRVSNIPLVSRY